MASCKRNVFRERVILNRTKDHGYHTLVFIATIGLQEFPNDYLRAGKINVTLPFYQT